MFSARFHALHAGHGRQKPRIIMGIGSDISVTDILQPFHVVQYENTRSDCRDVFKKCVRLNRNGNHGSGIEMASLLRSGPVQSVAALYEKRDIVGASAIDDEIIAQY